MPLEAGLRLLAAAPASAMVFRASAEHTLIGHRAAKETWPFRSASGARRDVEIETRTVAPEPDLVRTMLLGGGGIGILPDFHAADAVASGALVRVLFDHEHRSVDVHALYPSPRSLSAKVRVFIDTLVDDLTGHGRRGAGQL